MNMLRPDFSAHAINMYLFVPHVNYHYFQNRHSTVVTADHLYVGKLGLITLYSKIE